jgi:UDP-glucose:(heptosyl)LPS alpha-1,3-glucosyltransferase
MKTLSLAVVRQRYAVDGGAERFVARLLDALQGRNLRVTLVTREWSSVSGFDVVALDPFYIGRLWRDWSFARAVCKRLALQHYDIVQSHERISCCDVYRAGDGVHREWLAQRARALGKLERLGQRISPYHWYTCRAERRLFQSPRLRAVICNSNMVKDEIVRHFGVSEERLRVVYSGIDTGTYHPDLRRHRTDVRARYGIPETATLFLFIGSGFARKGLAALLEAFATLAAEAHLLVVGRDKHSGRYEAHAARLGLRGRVQFLGSQPDVKPFYGAADGLVLPTLYDPFPNVVLEAMASGLPVVTSTKCGAAEFIDRGVNGFVCDALDTPALAKALEVLRRPERCEAMSRAARIKVEGYDLSTMSGKLIELYRELIGAGEITSRE